MVFLYKRISDEKIFPLLLLLLLNIINFPTVQEGNMRKPSPPFSMNLVRR